MLVGLCRITSLSSNSTCFHLLWIVVDLLYKKSIQQASTIHNKSSKMRRKGAQCQIGKELKLGGRSSLPNVNRKKTPKCFFDIQSTKQTDCDKIWYTLSWVNLSYRNVNIFHLTWIMSLPYLAKLSIRVLQVNSRLQLELWTENTPKCFCHIVYKTRPILKKFGTCFPDLICHNVMSKSTICTFYSK